MFIYYSYNFYWLLLLLLLFNYTEVKVQKNDPLQGWFEERGNYNNYDWPSLQWLWISLVLMKNQWTQFVIKCVVPLTSGVSWACTCRKAERKRKRERERENAICFLFMQHTKEQKKRRVLFSFFSFLSLFLCLFLSPGFWRPLEKTCLFSLTTRRWSFLGCDTKIINKNIINNQ